VICLTFPKSNYNLYNRVVAGNAPSMAHHGWEKGGPETVRLWNIFEKKAMHRVPFTEVSKREKRKTDQSLQQLL